MYVGGLEKESELESAKTGSRGNSCISGWVRRAILSREIQDNYNAQKKLHHACMHKDRHTYIYIDMYI